MSNPELRELRWKKFFGSLELWELSKQEPEACSFAVARQNGRWPRQTHIVIQLGHRSPRSQRSQCLTRTKSLLTPCHSVTNVTWLFGHAVSVQPFATFRSQYQPFTDGPILYQ